MPLSFRNKNIVYYEIKVTHERRIIMNKIFTIIVPTEEKEYMDQIMIEYESDISDFQISKNFDLGLINVVIYIIVTTEEVFNEMVRKINGVRTY